MTKQQLRVLRIILFFFMLARSSLPSRSNGYGGGGNLESFVYGGCSPQRFAPGPSPYQFDVESVLSSLATSAGFSSYSNFTSSDGDVSGFFQCRGDVSLDDCQPCVAAAVSRLADICPAAVGGAVMLSGCFLRYGNDSFVGRPDLSLVLNKCGTDVVNPGAAAGELPGMVAAALGELGAALPTGTYRAAASGYVQAMAQCDGDIGLRACGVCVGAALGQLQAACGGSGAVSGDVYLGKCYARYWADGGAFTPDSSSGDGGSGGDNGSKTWAIAIGILAAVALIIVFLSCVKRTASGKS